MIDIVAQIFLSALFAVGVRWVQLHRRYEVLSVGAVNYIVAFACGIVTLFAASGAAEGWALGGLRAAAPALLTGAALGLSYFVAFFLLLRTLELRGATITTALSRLAVLVPIALAVALWGERPGAIQWLGIAVSVGAVFLMNAPQRSPVSPGREVGWAIPLVFFLVAGGAFASQETFNHVAQPADKPLFLAAGFAVAAAGSLVLLAVRRIRPTARELSAGVILGVANAVQVFVLLRALDRLPGFLVFAATGAGGVIGTAVMAAVVLRERPRGLRGLGVGVAAAALVLMQVR